MSDSFYVGQKVVCINDNDESMSIDFAYDPNQKYHGDLDGLKKGEVYTIRWEGMYEDQWTRPHYCVRVNEIYRPPCLKGDADDNPYDARRFKPLEEKKRDTDISIFTKLLGPAPKKKVLEDV